MLRGIFDAAETECPIEIIFTPTTSGAQQNDCRDTLLQYVRSPRIENGRALAARLQAVTTHRSKLGLLVLTYAKSGSTAKIVLSRFPADQGILAEQSTDTLDVQFLEKVFVKSLFSYKAAVYAGPPASNAAFWTGRAIDKQIDHPGELADYWIRDFLMSELRTTPAAGTMRFAEALVSAIRKADDLDTKHQLTAVATLARGLGGKAVSGESIAKTFGLSDSTSDALLAEFKTPRLARESFQFDTQEFERRAPLRSLEIDNGAILTAATGDFDQVFTQEELPGEGRIRFSTEGQIVDERLRKAKP